MNKRILLHAFLMSTLVLWSCSSGKNESPVVKVISQTKNQRVDILVNNKLFTSFLYTDTIPDLTKPVLYPVISTGGSTVTRGYPLKPRPGERTDHPHHIGMWFTYGDVNHIDFWGNSSAMPASLHDKLGWIRNVKILKTENGQGKGALEYSADWLNSKGVPLLKEHTLFIFKAGKDTRIIDRVTTLTAQKDTVVFYDTKEGMMGIRVNRALELPSDKPVTLTDAHGDKTEVKKMDNTGVTGNYLTSEGITGKEAWGKRAKWVSLSGEINHENVSITIFDHPGNPGYPSYWHARGYGLFAVNPLGQKVFSKGKKTLNLTLLPGKSVTFKYRVLIKTGPVTAGELNKEFEAYAGQ